MKVAVWTDERLGPAAVFIPNREGPPDAASVPACPPAPFRQWSAKGNAVSWAKWIEHLTDKLPYGGQWSVQEVPDGSDAAGALRHVREQVTMQGMTQEEPAQPDN